MPSATPQAAKEEIDVNFALSIGPDYWEKRKNVFDFKQDTASILNQGKMKTYVGNDQVTFKGPAVRVALKGANARLLGTIRPKTDPVDFPAVIAQAYGKGQVVYFATGFDAAYYLYAYPYQRLCLKHAIEWAANSKPPVAIEAPMCVHSTVMHQSRDGERLVVHLFNDLNTTAQRALPVDDVPLREEVVPIHDIVVTFDSKYRIKKVHLEPGGKELEVNKTLKGPSVTVPRLSVHAMVVAELSSVFRCRTSVQPVLSNSSCPFLRLGLFPESP